MKDGIAELLVTLGQNNMLSVHKIESLNCEWRCDHCLPCYERLKYFDTHPSAETQWHDRKRGLIEIGHYIGHASSNDNILVRQLPYPGCRLVSNDVQDQSWEARLHSRKNHGDQTHGCVDVRRMSKISYKEQAQRLMAKRIERMLRNHRSKRDSHDGCLLRQPRDCLPVGFREHDDCLDLSDDCPFESFPGKVIKIMWHSCEASTRLPHIASRFYSRLMLGKNARRLTVVKSAKILSHHVVFDLHDIRSPRLGDGANSCPVSCDCRASDPKRPSTNECAYS